MRKGYTERAGYILALLDRQKYVNRPSVEQDMLFYPNYKQLDKPFNVSADLFSYKELTEVEEEKDIMLWAEYLFDWQERELVQNPEFSLIKTIKKLVEIQLSEEEELVLDLDKIVHDSYHSTSRILRNVELLVRQNNEQPMSKEDIDKRLHAIEEACIECRSHVTQLVNIINTNNASK